MTLHAATNIPPLAGNPAAVSEESGAMARSRASLNMHL
jgi:hypothetical protein